MQVGARVEIVRDAGGDDGEDGSGALAAGVEPSEEPIFATEDQAPQLTLTSIVGELNVAIIEKERETIPLSMQVARSTTERSLGRNEGALVVEPSSELYSDRCALAVATRESLFCGVTGQSGRALDREQGRDDAEALERNGVPLPCSLDEAPPGVRHATWALATGALNTVGSGGAIALHGARQGPTEKIRDALGVAVRGIEEAHPTCVGPTPHGAGADAFRDGGVQDRDASRVGAEIAWRASAHSDQLGNGHEQIDVRGDAASERLWRNFQPGASEAQTLSPDGLMLDVLVAGGLGDQGVAKLAALDDRRWRRSRDDRVVVGARRWSRRYGAR